MAKKDKFQQLKQDGGTLSSFQDMVEQASTVAAIAQQAEVQQSDNAQGGVGSKPADPNEQPTQRLTHLPNPRISVRDYNLATQYCYQHDNMTRLDWMERAIVNQLNRDGLITDEELTTRLEEIRRRPPRGMRKNTKVQTDK